MADERHEWLDEDVAERLLRGENVVPADDRAREQAERLSAVLRALAGPDVRQAMEAPAARELPGEAAALAAFRRARAEAGAPSGALADTVVRVGRERRGTRAPRRLRPVRFGLAAALAGCALGGVAMAAGTGVLPGLGAADEPVASVSAATPGPISSDSPSARTGAPVTPRSPTPDRSPSGRAATPGATSSGSAEPPKATPDTTATSEGKQGDWATKKVEYCRDFRSGRLDQTRRHRLEIAALGAARVKQFCDSVIEEAERGGKGGSGGKGDSGGEGGSGDDKGDGHGGHGGTSGGRGSRDGSVLKLPTVSWSTPPTGGSPALPGLPGVPGAGDADRSGPTLPPAVPVAPPASRALPKQHPTALLGAAVPGAHRALAHGLDRLV
ncbi:hypothetical protein A8W25_18845 [Streptomyces sp. ERV7]|uniref:hypothetical protein n=1 Tax=Streptomyces sp. ERV7 TaxID=1322334 RepID=UPI0007F523BB|nr:hypothetical protein [Streptomyces sp. ERV7]OAR24457.1 hypothetical protein A8W25_18845 [Streptomyces sp. ERV7]